MSSKRSKHLLFDIFDEKIILEECSENFFRAGQQKKQIKKLDKEVRFSFDFHGYTVEEAKNTLNQHLNLTPYNHVCLIIHGKGLSSGSKIKKSILNFLKSHERCYAYKSAEHGDVSGSSLVKFSKKK